MFWNIIFGSQLQYKIIVVATASKSVDFGTPHYLYFSH